MLIPHILTYKRPDKSTGRLCVQSKLYLLATIWSCHSTVIPIRFDTTFTDTRSFWYKIKCTIIWEILKVQQYWTTTCHTVNWCNCWTITTNIIKGIFIAGTSTYRNTCSTVYRCVESCVTRKLRCSVYTNRCIVAVNSCFYIWCNRTKDTTWYS